jgi:hypothetical protein
LTERILDRLGAPRWWWMVLWVAVPVLTPVVLLGTLALQGDSDRVLSPVDVMIPQVVLGYVVFLLLWGTGRLTRQAEALAPHLSKLTQGRPIQPGLPERSDILGPVLLTLATLGLASIGWTARFGPLATVAIVPLFGLTFLPIMTFVWTYLALLIGLDRLGRGRLSLDTFPQDTSLGLAPVGSLAFTGFALLLAGALPIAVSNADDLSTVVVLLVVLGVSVALLFLSMWRLHRQMADAKARYVAQVRAAYADAYEPYREDESLATLEAQATALGAAQALDERARQIQEWPLDQRLVRILGFIVAAVASTIIGRFVLLLLAG